MTLPPRAKQGLKLYFSNALVYLLGLLIINYVPYYRNALSTWTQNALFSAYLAYLLLSPFYYAHYVTEQSENKSLLFLRFCRKLLSISRWRTILPDEKIAALFMGVKLFFLPTMVNFVHQNFSDFPGTFRPFDWYSFALTLVFALDTLVFTVGYAVELPQLRNLVKSVEPTLFGWFVTIICYPPFNGLLGNYIPWGASDYAEFWSPGATSIVRVLVLLLLLIYVWATVALGFKASNLTNRGIVTKFPYSIVRHPAYVSKVTVWWLTLIPVMSIPFALGMLFWTGIYYFRAVTEERHLLNDTEYQEYCSKVEYKFIPKVF